MVDAREVLTSLGRRVWLIALCVLLAALAALVLSLRQDEQYSANAVLLVPRGGVEGMPESAIAANNIILAGSDRVAKRVADDLGKGLTRSEVGSKVVVGRLSKDAIQVTASDSSPRFAAELANSYAARARDAVVSDNAEIAKRARVPASSSLKSVARSTTIGALLGLLLGAVLALLLGRLDRRIEDVGKLEEAFGQPILGAIPESRALASFVKGSGSTTGHPVPVPLPSGEVEAFRTLGTRLRYFNSARNLRSLVVTSALPGEGKTTIAANLAITEAGAGPRIILVEADFRRPTLAAAAGVNRVPGLAEVLTGRSTLANAVQQVADQPTQQRHLDVLVAGTPPQNPITLLEDTKMSTLLQELATDHDLVLIDAPPLNVLADAIPLITLADGVLIVGEVGRLTPDDVLRLREHLRSLSAEVYGVIANRSPTARKQGYGYYNGDDRPSDRAWSSRPDPGEREPATNRAPRTGA